jgi:Ca2+-binding EF-hand superfamily protein
MGKGISKSADLAPFTEWERKSVDDLLQKYKDEDLPFGLSEKQATTLLTDEALVKKVFNFFAGSEKTLSALEMLCSVALLATGSVEERKASLFTAFDFNKVGKICSAELVIMVICVVKAYMSVLVGNVKTAEDAMVAKDVEQGIEEIVNNKFGVDGEDITLESFNEFVVEEFDQLAGASDDFVAAGKVVLKRFGLEVAADEPVAEVPTAEETVAEEPVAEVPVAEEPVAEEPVAESTEEVKEAEPEAVAPAAEESAAVAPDAEAEQPAESEAAAPTESEAAAESEAAPAESEETPPAAEESTAVTPDAEAEQPAASEEAAPTEAAAESEAAPAESEETTPPAAEESPAESEAAPAESEETPPAAEESPPSEESPAESEAAPAESEETPPAAEEAPSE